MLMGIISLLIYILAKSIYVYILLICVRCLLTWFPGVNWNNPILSALKSSVDLYLDLFRKFIPPLGMFDLSPLVATFVLIVIQNLLIGILVGF